MATNLGDSGDILKKMYGKISITNEYMSLFDSRFARKGHSVVTEHEPMYLIDRERFARNYREIILEGIEMGYLVYNGECGECAGEPEIDESTSVTDWVIDESEEEYQARMKALHPGGTVTFPVFHSEIIAMLDTE